MKRRTKKAEARRAEMRRRKELGLKPKGKSRYAKKAARSARGHYAPTSPFYLSEERQAEALATFEASGRLPSYARFI